MNRTHAMPTSRALTSFRGGAALAMLTLLTACSADDIIGNAKLPPDVIDPGALHNTQGAVAAYRSAAALLREGLNVHVRASGLLSDELATTKVGRGVGHKVGWEDAVDSRLAQPEFHDRRYLPYASLQKTRGQVRQALGMLREFAPGSSPALQGHLHSMDGYATVMLAELYCSGIPLSELVYRGDYRLEGASTTAQVLERALASFDTAIAMSTDSARFLDLARVGRGRALLGLGRYTEAAEAVAAVPTGYGYAVQYPTDSMANFFTLASGYVNNYSSFNMSDGEGANGLPFRSSGDPRTRAVLLGMGQYAPHYRPARYEMNGRSPIVLASGIEARLIEAEAALTAGGNWLAMLNALRTDGTFTTRPNTADPAVTDTTWSAGSGAVAGLAPLADTGTPAGRVDLLFRERAFWLHLTGIRAGDLRRLVRQYGRAPDTVFPVGPYLGALGSYGASTSLSVPDDEITYNPLYSGCLSEDA